MTPERWQRVKEVLQGVMQLAPPERGAFLDRACSSDASLRAEIESLLSADEQIVSSFLECPPIAGPRIGVGTRLGDYEVVSLLGSGGMGEVYRARDLRLGREVAIKVLPPFFCSDPDRLRRFEKEARAAAALSHLNILAVYQLGTYEGAPYLVTELLQGETLRALLKGGALSVRQAVDYALQIARGLAAAHEKGIVHRDLKPENLFVTRNGCVKILDFGLAKLTAPQGQMPDDTSTLTVVTNPGAVMGTPGYMAPEQVRGQTVNGQVDIFALGAVLYEMLSGRRAFPGVTLADVMTATLKEEPPSLSEVNPSTTPALEGLVRRCLEKSPEQRFQSASDLTIALEALRFLNKGPSGTPRVRRWLVLGGVAVLVALLAIAYVVTRNRAGDASQPKIRSLAVLPLTNLSGDPAKEYLADGMTEALIGRLSRIHDLRVISRTSVMHFKDTQLSVPEIARTLKVDAIVEGSVIREGSRVRVSAQLIRGATDEHLWSETYDRELRDVLALQSEVAQSIAGKVEVTVAGKEHQRLTAVRSVSPEVYESYLKGRFALNKGDSRADIDESIGYFEEAIKRDPTFAPAYVGLAEAYHDLGSVFSGAPPEKARSKALSAARKALELDPDSAEAHVQLAWIQQTQWQWAEAESEDRRALELNPSDAAAHDGLANLLLYHGRTDEALAWARRARELDPVGVSGASIEWILFYSRRYNEAIHECRSALAVRPDDAYALWQFGMVLIANRQPEEAIPVLEKAVSVSNRSPAVIGVLVRAYAHAGRRTDALRLLSELKRRQQTSYVPAGAFVMAYLGLDEYDQAFAWLEQAYQEQSYILLFLKVHPFFDPVRDDPRFAELLRRVGLD